MIDINQYLEKIMNNVWLIKVVISILLLLGGLIVARIIGKMLARAVEELEIDKILNRLGIRISLSRAVDIISTVTVYIIFVILALNELGITATLLYILLIFILILILVSSLLTLKDLVPNAIAGISIMRKRSFKIGDKIILKDLKGKVKKVGISETVILTKEGDTVFVPNSFILKNIVRIKR